MRLFGERIYGHKVDLNKDVKKLARYMRDFVESPGEYIDFSYPSSAGKLIYTKKGKVTMEGSFSLTSIDSKGWNIAGKAGYLKSHVGNDYGVYINFQDDPSPGEWYDPNGGGLQLADKLIGKPKKFTKHILNDDNFIALHGVKAKASAMKGDDFFMVDAKKSTLKGGKGSDSYWFSDWAGEKESTILDFDPSKDKIIISKDDAFDITTGMIGGNTIVSISDTASVLLKGVRLKTEEINFEITKRDFDGFDLLSML